MLEYWENKSSPPPRLADGSKRKRQYWINGKIHLFVIESNPKFGIIQLRRSIVRNLKFDEFVKSRIHQVLGVSYSVFGMK
jgi:hypothetical protein